MTTSWNITPAPFQSDLELVRAAAEGDGVAFRTLVDRHASGLLRLALRLSRNRADAEDALQETLIGAFLGLGVFGARASVKTWLTRILIWQAAKVRRRARGRRRRVPINCGAAAAPRRSNALVSPASDVDRRIDLADLIATLTAEHRAVIRLRDLEGLPYGEVARVLGLPRGTVQSRLHRAHTSLGLRLGAYRFEGAAVRRASNRPRAEGPMEGPPHTWQGDGTNATLPGTNRNGGASPASPAPTSPLAGGVH